MTDFSGDLRSTDTLAALARGGRWIRWLLVSYALIVSFGAIASVWLWPRLLLFQPSLIGRQIDLTALTWPDRLAACATLCVSIIPLLWALAEAFLLCHAMTARRLFSTSVPVRLRRMGIALLAAAFSRPLSGMLLAIVIDRATHSPDRHLVLSFSSDDLGLALVGAILIAVAAAAREAVRLAEENSRFV
ncbi:MAG TPA: DUF2975 domain-containing protein [Stellaceae bacterium]|nr:DUF2975 domain-containing protein [Stellaceae bacterium]